MTAALDGFDIKIIDESTHATPNRVCLLGTGETNDWFPLSIDDDGRAVTVDLDDIYDLARDAFSVAQIDYAC